MVLYTLFLTTPPFKNVDRNARLSKKILHCLALNKNENIYKKNTVFSRYNDEEIVILGI